MRRRSIMKSLAQYAAENPIVVPDTASGHYLPVAQLLQRWEWEVKVEAALIAGDNVPHAVVADYLAKSRTAALPPSRRKDYPDLAAMYPICYAITENGKRVLV
jgi:hypothetical protein